MLYEVKHEKKMYEIFINSKFFLSTFGLILGTMQCAYRFFIRQEVDSASKTILYYEYRDAYKIMVKVS